MACEQITLPAEQDELSAASTGAANPTANR